MERLTFKNEQGEAHMNCNQMCADFYKCNPDVCQGKKAIQKLADYEDAEEQGLLLRLPCKVGDTVYDVCCGKIYTRIARGILLRNEKIWIQDGNGCDIGVWGGTVFATESEAQEALERMVQND